MQLSPTTLDTRFAEAMGQLLGPDFPQEIALAVSGGGDSMAMLGLAHNWARVWGVGLRIVTVDHGLRTESAEEAAMVAREAESLGWSHTTLQWHWDGRGNLQDAARRARLALIEGWRDGIGHVLFAHTRDDLAETFLLRLTRGSGVEGLSAMQPSRRISGSNDASGFHQIRPCLGMSRSELRHYATALRIPWVDDPSNDDPKYDRVRARRILTTLHDLGLTVETLDATAQRMSRASVALRARACSIAEDIVLDNRVGGVTFDRAGFEAVERDTQMRLLAAACMWVSGAQYRPRATALEKLLDRLLGGGAGTLSGAKAEMSKDTCQIFREFQAVADLVTPLDNACVWDGRWHISGPKQPGQTVRALGRSLSEVTEWQSFGLARSALMATPAVFLQDTLIAAPVLEHGAGWEAQTAPSFRSYLLSH